MDLLRASGHAADPPDPQIIGFWDFLNPVLNDLGRFRAIFRNSADFREISWIFQKSPIVSTHFLSLGGIWLFPGDPARKKLPGDALGSRFGAMRVRISHKTMFLNVQVPACRPSWKGKGKRQREEKGKGKGQTVKFFPGSD